MPTFPLYKTAAASMLCGAMACTTSLAHAGSYKLLYAFKDDGSGSNPGDDLAEINGVLYGTTLHSHGKNCDDIWCGTVFAVTRDGHETSLYTFKGGQDGWTPHGLISMGGTLYGTTEMGGNTGCHDKGCGTIFTVMPTGQKKTLYTFKDDKDGAEPGEGLATIGTTLYGETGRGGDHGYGALFNITPDGIKKTLYAFKTTHDGMFASALIAANGMFYGTASQGGADAAGMAYAITPDGTETILHSFKDTPDGENPNGPLLNAGGVFYGTTYLGGRDGNGAVFAIGADGKEKILYSFKGGQDGAKPMAGLIAIDGLFYGTTTEGGGKNCGGTGCGTLFSVTPGGVEKTLYRFNGNGDGASPGALLYTHGLIYGTAHFGGIDGCDDGSGCGTVFSFKP